MDNNSLSPKQQQRRLLLALGGASVVNGLVPEAFGNTDPHHVWHFPRGFYWGAATAGHQVEGQNVNCDSWLLENMKPTLFDAPSGDACNHYQLFDQDIALLADLGLNTFRFSVEWSRIEPVEGMFSLAEMEHYRQVLDSCRRRGVHAMVTFNHFTTPRWFAALGGWENPASEKLFARYCKTVAQHLGSYMTFATTLNEPNLTQLLFGIPGFLSTKLGTATDQEIIDKAGQLVGTGRFSAWVFGDYQHIHQGLLKGHRAGYEAIKSVCPNLPVGISLAMTDDQAVGEGAAPMLARKRRLAYEPWFELSQHYADFMGVQTYSRARIGAQGLLPPEPGVPLTDMGYEYYPQALEGVIRYTHKHLKIPIYVTENGISATDDTRRIAYIHTALQGVARCLRDGIDVKGYIHWSLLDNFEWLEGYSQYFGLVAVDLKTFRRDVKPSATYLGQIARSNSIARD
jgi:beta-glucosidase